MTRQYPNGISRIGRTLFAGVVAGLFSVAHAADRVEVAIPTVEEVGAANLPEGEIAPVVAPFAMPEFRKPIFPERTVSIVEHGAVEGEPAREAINGAIDAVSAAGGGTVVVPAGKWLTGRVELKSNVNLHIAEGAELEFSGDVADYQPAVFTRNEGVEMMSLGALIYANGADNIAVTGRGLLTGPPRECEVRRQVANADVVENLIDASTPVEERLYEGHDGGPVFLPMFISPHNSTNVYIEGVTLERTAFWNIVPVYCVGVIIRGVTVNSVGIPRGDGIDIESSRNVLIEYSTLNCGDDCFTMKAGRGHDGLRVNKPTENVVVRYCLAQRGHGGITLGSETAGRIRNLYLHDCVFNGTGVGIRFKTRRPRGGGGENVTLERIRMDLTGTAIKADMLGSSRYVGELADRLPVREVNELTPFYRNVSVKDVIINTEGWFMQIIGIPESPYTNFRLENANVTSRDLMRLRDAREFVFKNVGIESAQARMEILDARDVLFEGVSFDVPGGAVETEMEGENSGNIRFVDCEPEKPAGWEGTDYAGVN